MGFRGQVILVITFALLVGGSGVAAADPVAQEKVTSDKYYMRLSMEGVVIQSVPNMAAAPFVREGYVSGTTRLHIECRDSAMVCPPIVAASLAVSAQIGCAMNFKEGISLQPQADLAAGLPDTLGQLLPDNGDITTIAITPTVTGIGPGSLAVDTKPGFINDLELGRENIPATSVELQKLTEAANLATAVDAAIEKDKTESANAVRENLKTVGQRIEAVLNQKATDGLAVSVANRHLVVDRSNPQAGACGGPVAIRLYAQGTIKTATSSDKMDMYSDISTL